MTPEQQVRIFHTYIPCKGKIIADDVSGEVKAGDIVDVAAYNANVGDLQIWPMKDHNDDTWTSIDNVKLILKPLSDMGEEDAIAVAKIEDKNVEFTNHGKVVKIDRYQFVKHGLEDKVYIGIDRYWKDKYFGYSPLPLIASLYSLEQIDYLRSKSYDMGYCEIPSLIHAGFAVTQ